MDPLIKGAYKLTRERPGYVVACVACYLAIGALALCISAVGIVL